MHASDILNVHRRGKTSLQVWGGGKERKKKKEPKKDWKFLHVLRTSVLGQERSWKKRDKEKAVDKGTIKIKKKGGKQ